MQNRFYYSFFLFLIISLNNFAQKSSKNFNIVWESNDEFAAISTNNDTDLTNYPVVKSGSTDNNFLPIFSKSWKMPSNLKVQSYKIENIVYKNISKKIFHKQSQRNFPAKLESNFTIKNAKNQAFAILDLTPLVIINGQLKKIISFKLTYSTSLKAFSKNSSSIHNSPFASGQWFRFAIDKTGVYKLNRSFITSLGIDANTNPKNIKIYGNGGAMLNELNSDFRYDDIQENAIYFHGEQDGSLDSEDYILFYAEGPNVWKPDLNTNLATHQTNTYSDQAFYYITVGNDLGKRIQQQSNITTTANITATTSNHYMLHEQELFNFDSLGQQFFW